MNTVDTKCVFCHKGTEEEECGHLYVRGKRAAHYYCMLYSSGLFQKATSSQEGDFDDFGGGFEYKAVLKEVKRGNTLRCSRKSCHNKKGATVGCDRVHCKSTYHYLCAKKEGKFQQCPSDELSERHINYEIKFFCKKHVIDLVGGFLKHEVSSEEELDDSSKDGNGSEGGNTINVAVEDYINNNNNSQLNKPILNAQVHSPVNCNSEIQAGVSTVQKTSEETYTRTDNPTRKRKLETDRVDTEGKKINRANSQHSEIEIKTEPVHKEATSTSHCDKADKDTEEHVSHSHHRNRKSPSSPVLDGVVEAQDHECVCGRSDADRVNADSCHSHADVNSNLTDSVGEQQTLTDSVKEIVCRIVQSHMTEFRTDIDQVKEQIKDINDYIDKDRNKTDIDLVKPKQRKQTARKHMRAQHDSPLPPPTVIEIDSDSDSDFLPRQSLLSQVGSCTPRSRDTAVSGSGCPKISEEVYKHWTKLQKNGLPSHMVNEKCKSWGIGPKTKKRLQPPALSAKLKSESDKSSQELDQQLQKMCMGYHQALVPLLCIASKNYDSIPEDVKRAVDDAIELAGVASSKSFKMRKNLLKGKSATPSCSNANESGDEIECKADITTPSKRRKKSKLSLPKTKKQTEESILKYVERF